MGILSKLEPEGVFYYFEEICGIPHGSGNVGQISDYLAAFARERKLFFIQDEWKNIIIIKEASEGYEKEPAVILQGHMDMVAVKKPDCDIDMTREGLKLAVDGDKIYAQGTSLGGDDGIAVAYALALLDAHDIGHPRLEVVITVDEEVGMDGAREIDLSMLKARRMLNLDSEEEGIFLTSCAGGARVNCHLPLPWGEMEGASLEICLKGLQGGHSGVEIHKERGNANVLMGRLLYHICQKAEFGIRILEGGLADNAIPREARAVLVTAPEDRERIKTLIREFEEEAGNELASRDPDFYMETAEGETGCFACVAKEQALRCAAYLCSLPNGVQSFSRDIEGLVETSLNLGILTLEEDGLHVEFSVRSSIESAKHALLQKLDALTVMAGGSQTVTGDYPGWKYRVDSPLREKMLALYEEMYGEKPQVQAIHAGLECGLLMNKIPELDCVSFGPDMSDIHTTEETLSISSTRRVWEYLVRLLEEKENG